MAVYSVNKIPLVWIPVSDGTKPAATLWIPKPKEDETAKIEKKFPAILGNELIILRLVLIIFSVSMYGLKKRLNS